MVGTEVLDVRLDAVDGNRVYESADFGIFVRNHWIGVIVEMWCLGESGKISVMSNSLFILQSFHMRFARNEILQIVWLEVGHVDEVMFPQGLVRQIQHISR